MRALRALAVFLCLLALAFPASADELFQNFESWPVSVGVPPTNQTFDGWNLYYGNVRPDWGAYSPTSAVWLINSTTTNAALQTPLQTNGIGTFSFYCTNRTVASIDFRVETSTNGTTWDLKQTVTNTAVGWTQYVYVVNSYSNIYFRILRPFSGVNSQLGLDNVQTRDPPARVDFSGVTPVPTPPRVNDPVNIQAGITPTKQVSNITATTLWRLGTTGGWTPIGMVTNALNTHITTSAIPGQGAGILVQYYVNCEFQGPYAISPTNYPAQGSNGPAAYIVQDRDFYSAYSNLFLTDDFATNMARINDYFWQAVPSSGIANPDFRFRGVSTNGVTTNYWGETNQPGASLPIAGAAELDGTNINVGATNTGQFVVRFNETNLQYSVRQCVYDDFSTWDRPTYGTYTNNNWVVWNAAVFYDGTRERVGKACFLESNTLAGIRSPYMSEGIGEVSFWYRNWQTNGSPATKCYIQKSMTGGTNAYEWVAITNVSDIVGTSYNRYSLVLGDRNYHYVRLINATNVANARLCLDEVLFVYPSAGVLISNLVNTPAVPCATNPVHVSAVMTLMSGASNRDATTYYRTGTTGTWYWIGMTNSGGGDSFITTNPIPPGRGPGADGVGLVQYYVTCEYQGYESQYSTPARCPADGSLGPTSYTIIPAYVAFTNVATTPDPPLVNTPISIEADVIPLAAASNVRATNYYRIGGAGGYTPLSMTNTISNHYVTLGAIPAQSNPGTPLEYYLTVTFLGPSALTPTNFPAAGSGDPVLILFRIPALSSSYTNMTLTGSLNTNVWLVDNYWRQTVLYATNLINAGFWFNGFAAGTEVWGDANPSVSNMPVDGTAELGATNIVLAGTNSGYFIFQFNESNQQYAVQRCAYVNFDAWATEYEYKTYTNSDGWVIEDGRTTTNSYPTDVARVYRGRSCVLNEAKNTNQYLLSPYLPAGVGEIGFVYRNWQTNATPAVGFHVQIAQTATGTWSTVGTVTNILSVDYLRFSMGLSDRTARYVRVIGTTTSTHARLCLDEVFVAEPAAGIAFSGLTQSPASPCITNLVTVSVNISPLVGASNLNPSLWYRIGTNGGFDGVVMTNVSGSLYCGTIPYGQAGIMQYYVRCDYTGLRSELSSPSYYPYGGSNSPAVYTNLDANTNFFQSFDAWAPNVVPGYYTTNGWVINDGSPRGGSGYEPYTPSNACWLVGDASFTNSYVRSPLLSSAFGPLIMTFRARNRNVASIYFDVQLSTDGVYWSHLVGFANAASNSWTEYSVTLPTTYTSFYVRIFKTEITGNGQLLGIDELDFAYSPAGVMLANVMIHPGYPATDDTVCVSCTIASATPLPAFDIQGKILWQVGSGPTNAITMSRSNTYFVTGNSITGQPWKSEVRYWIQSDFKGYYHLTNQNLSSMYYPSGGPTNSTNYIVRLKKSDYDVINVVSSYVADVSMRQLNDYEWQALPSISAPLDPLQFAFAGMGQYTGVGYSPGITNWGDSAWWKTNLPLYSAGGPTQAVIPVYGNLTGEHVFRFNERTCQYSLQKCRWQEFDNWSTPAYMSVGSDNTLAITNSFDSWPTNQTRSRFLDFEGNYWSSVSTFTEEAFPGENETLAFGIRRARIGFGGNPAHPLACEITNEPAWGYGYVAYVPFLETTEPLRGVGTVSFDYSPNSTNVFTNWLTVAVYLCPTNKEYRGGAWWEGPYLGITNFSAFVWNTATKNIRTNESMTAIIHHKAGWEYLWLDNICIDEWYADTKNTGGWVAAESWITPSGAHTAPNCCEFDTSRANGPMYLRFPRMTNGVGFLDFFYRNATAGVYTFAIELCPGASDPENPSNWSTQQAVTNTATDWTQFSRWIMTNNDVYLQIRHTSTNYARLQIDDARITQVPQGELWAVDNAKISADKAFLNNSCVLNNGASGTGFPCNIEVYPNIRTPRLTNGIGEISFWFRNYESSGSPPATFFVQKSAVGGTNMADWVTLAVVTNVVNTSYNYFRTNIYDPTSHYARIFNHTNYIPGACGRLCIDDLLVTDPISSDLVLGTITLSPPIPLYCHSVRVECILSNPFLNPSNIEMWAHYATATSYGGWGATTPIPMTLMSSNLTQRTYTYCTTSQIPPQSVDTYVQYYVECQFDGLMTEVVSPKYDRAFVTPTWYLPVDNGTSTPYYIVYSCPIDSVWFNEVNTADYFGGSNHCYTNEYIELCGPANVNIRNWSIEITTESGGYVDTYWITNNYILPNDPTGRSFWVLGDSNVTSRDMTLTNIWAQDDPEQHLPSVGRLVLKRSFGAIESKIIYGDPGVDTNFTYIGQEPWYTEGSLILTGTGTNYSDFLPWQYVEGQHSPGQVNTNQVIIVLTTNAPMYLTVISPHGMPSPAVGIGTYASNALLICKLADSPVFNGMTQYVCVGRVGSGSATSGSETNFSFYITDHSIVSWLWQTNYFLALSVSGNGSVDHTSAWYAVGAAETVTATAGTGSHFSVWTGDVPPGSETNNPLSFAMNMARSIMANLQLDGWAILATAGANGVIVPQGVVIVPHGGFTNFQITASNYYHVADVATNAASIGGPFGMGATNYTWTNIVSTGTIYAVFAANLTGRGTPEWWLAGYGQSTNDDNADPDNDRMKNWEEYVAGTIPTNPASVLAIAQIVWANGSNIVRWPSTTGGANLPYGMQRSTNLIQGNWIVVDPSISRNPPTNTWQEAAPPPRALYRIMATNVYAP